MDKKRSYPVEKEGATSSRQANNMYGLGVKLSNCVPLYYSVRKIWMNEYPDLWILNLKKKRF